MKIQNMRRSFSKKLGMAAMGTGAAVLLGAADAEAQTTLTGLAGPNIDVPTNHGSNAPDTPNISLTWSSTTPGLWDQYAGWPNDPSDGVYQIDGASDGTETHTIDFTPDADWNAIISGFDLNVWPGGGDTTVDWSVDGTSSGNLGAGTFSILNGMVSNENLNIIGDSNETLTLSLTQNSGIGSYLALDNLTFDQVAVPEPGTMAMFLLLGGAAGLGAMAMRRRKK